MKIMSRIRSRPLPLLGLLLVSQVGLMTACTSQLQRLKDTKQCSECDLRKADLRGLDLQGANLQAADLKFTNLAGAQLRGADLGFADLTNAKIIEEQLQQALLCSTTLPDGSKSKNC